MQHVRNYTVETFTNPHSGHKRKRQREATSCKPCRDRKVACDRARPACATCVDRRCVSSCTYASDAESSHAVLAKDRRIDDSAVIGMRNGKSSGKERATTSVPQLEEPVLEHHGRRHHSLTDAATSDETSSHRSNTWPVTEMESTSIERISRLENMVATLDTRLDRLEGAPIGVIDQSPVKQPSLYSTAVFDGRKCSESTMYLAQHSWSTPFSKDLSYLWTMRDSFAKQWSELQSLDANFEAPRRKGLWHFVNFKTDSEDSAAALRALIPEEITSVEMLTRFYKTFNIVYPIVDEAGFNRQVTMFWSKESNPSATWLALFLAIIALGFQCPISGRDVSNEANHPNGRRRGKWLMHLVMQHAVKLAATAKRPSLIIFQTLLVILVHEKMSLDWVDGSDMTSGLLGMVSRVALTIGLHRDPSNTSSMSPEELALRRNLFWTFVYLDFEQALHTGMQWRAIDGDIEHPNPSSGWTHYKASIGQGIPVYAEILRLSHSRQVSVSADRLASLRDQLEHLPLGASKPHDKKTSIDDFSSIESRLIVAIQKASSICLHERIHIVMQLPLLDTSDGAVRLRARRTMIKAADRMLDRSIKVIELVAQVPSIYRRGWTHFAIASLRCHLYYACSITIIILRRTTHLHGKHVLERHPADLIHKIEQVLRLLGYSLAISWESIKHQALLWAQYVSLMAQINGDRDDFIRDTADFDRTSEHGIRLMVAAQQGMENVIHMAQDAIVEARNSNDPPPSLLAEKVDKPQSTLPLPPTATSDPTLADDSVDDWLQEFDLWAGQGLDGILDF